MKNLLENVAMIVVILLSILVGYLIFQYNMIEDDTVEEIAYAVPQKKKVSAKSNTSNYVQSLEGYGDDVNVKVEDATKDDYENTLTVTTEMKDDRLGEVVEDKEKSAYMQNLESYAQNAEEAKLDTIEPSDDAVGTPEKLADKEVVDQETLTIGDTIESTLEGKEKQSNVEVSKPVNNDTNSEPETLDAQEVTDEIGMAIESAIDDL